jgi:uncharacterized protein YlzI (FlbEa/FlbD family)
MIKLTRMNDLEPTGLGERPVWLNLEHVVSVEPVKSERVEWNTSITMSYGFVGVKESPEEVVRLIEEATTNKPKPVPLELADLEDFVREMHGKFVPRRKEIVDRPPPVDREDSP